MTTTELINDVRSYLQDKDSPYHWSDDQIKSRIKLALSELNRIRPETRYVGMTLVDCVSLPVDASSEVDVNNCFRESIVLYVCHLCYLDDVTDPVSAGLAESFFQKFMARVMV